MSYLLFLCGLLFFNHHLSSRQTRDGHAERRSADVVHPYRVAELHALGGARMLTKNPYFELRTGFASLCNAPLHEHANALSVERLERVGGKHTRLLLIHVVRQEAAGVIAREAHGGLGKVVGSEGEEFGDFADFVGKQCCSRELDHSAYKVWQFDTGFLDEVIGYATGSLFEDPEFLLVEGERNHDLG